MRGTAYWKERFELGRDVNKALHAENAQMREALEKIMALDAAMSATNMFAAKAHTIARAAREGKK